jgi:hypothetical protein
MSDAHGHGEEMKTRGRPSEGQYRIESTTSVPIEFDALAGRRVAPFLDRTAIDTRPLGLLLKEVYRQGLVDAVEAMTAPRAQK